jgi:beta-phosphoglucomutase
MDGVIIDSHPAHRRAWQEFLATVGLNVPPQELDFILDGRKRHEILRHFLGEDVSDEQLSQYGRKKDEFFRQVSLRVHPVPGVIDFISDLLRDGFVLGVATSASMTRTRSTLRHLNLTDSFSAVVTGDDVPQGKPDPAIYNLVCRRLNCGAEHAIAIEDSISGVQAAKSAGLACIGVGGPDTAVKLRSAGADPVIESFVSFSLNDLKRLPIARPVSQGVDV